MTGRGRLYQAAFGLIFGFILADDASATVSVPLIQETGRVAADPPDEETEFATDRPDFTETAVVVPLHSLQLETGITYSDFRTFNLLSGPEALLRWGVGTRTEVRFGLPNLNRTEGPGALAGFGDSSIGFKQQLGPASGWDLAVIGAVFVPTGGRGLTTGTPDPVATFCWARDLAERWSLGGVMSIAYPTIGRRRQAIPFATASLSHALGGPWNGFLEYAGLFPERGGSAQIVHHGYTYAITPTSQADVHFGFGFTDAAPRFFIGGGYARRL